MSISPAADALLPPHAWPGCALGYAIVDGGEGAPALRITARFDRATAADASLIAWTAIRRHANDPSLEVTVSCSLQGQQAAGAPDQAIRDYRALVERLVRAAARGGDVPVTAAMTLPLDAARIAEGTDVLFPLEVSIAVARKRRTARGDKRTAWERVRSPLAPWLPPATEVADWARAEASLAGHDGAGGRIRFARPATEAGTGPVLWALRLGGRSGLGLAQSKEPAIAFVAQPLARRLQSGSAEVTTWDATLTPETRPLSAAGLDLDALFDAALSTLNRLLAPALAATFDRADPDALARIARARDAIARALARRLIPLLAEQAAGEDEAARHGMELAVRAGAAGLETMVLQVPLAASPDGLGLRLAIVSPRPVIDVSPAELLLDGHDDTRLTFSLVPDAGESRAILPIPLDWALTAIERLERAEDAAPAPCRFKLLVPSMAGAAPDLSLGNVAVPLASRLAPRRPVLTGQVAAGPDAMSGDTLADLLRAATRWSLAFTLPDGASQPQDDLWLAITFNRPPDWRHPTDDEAVPLTLLGRALFRFSRGHASLPPLPEDPSRSVPRAGELARIVAGLAEEVAAALTDLPEAVPAEPLASSATMDWVWRSRPNPDGSRALFVRGGSSNALDEPCFPTVNGRAPRDIGPALADTAPDDGTWQEATYDLPHGSGGTLAFVLDGLDLTSRQTAAAATAVARNARGSGLNPLLARTSGWAAGSVVMPAIDIADPLAAPPGDASLESMLAVALTPFLQAGRCVGGEWALRIDLAYRYPLDSSGGATTSMPILSTTIHPTDSIAAEEVAAALDVTARAWHETASPSRAGAGLILSAALELRTDGAAVPLLRIRQIELPLPPGWRDETPSPPSGATSPITHVLMGASSVRSGGT